MQQAPSNQGLLFFSLVNQPNHAKINKSRREQLWSIAMAPKPITKNTLFYGDNLDILREYVPDESVDLIYLDPPFNSSRNYNVLFKDESGKDSESQITAFEDTWHWNGSAENIYHELVTETSLSEMIGAMVTLTGKGQMGAYLVMMAARFLELRRILKSTGSIYVHCDSTASHYLKIILDGIFGPENFGLFGNCRASESGSTASERPGRVLPVFRSNRSRSSFSAWRSDAVKRG